MKKMTDFEVELLDNETGLVKGIRQMLVLDFLTIRQN